MNGPAIVASIGGDVSGLKAAGAEAENAAGVIAGKIAKKFEFRDVGRTLATALGLNLEGLAEKLVTPFRESAEASEEIATSSDRATEAVLGLIRAHQTDLEKLQALEKQAKRLREEMERPTKEISFWRGALASVLAQMGFIGTAATVIADDQHNAVESAAKAAELKQKELEIYLQEQKILAENMRFQEEISIETLDYVRSHREELDLQVKAMAGRILPAEQLRLDILRLQNKEKNLQYSIEGALAVAADKRTPADKQNLQIMYEQSRRNGLLLKQKEDLLKATEAQGAAETKVADAIDQSKTANDEFVDSMNDLFDKIQGVSKEWDQFKTSITTVGRGDKELSDRELQRKVANIRKDLSTRGANDSSYFAVVGDGGQGVYDPLGDAQKLNLQKALAELNFRQKVRTTAQAFGQNTAFSQFGGLTEQRFAEILRTQDASSQVVAQLKELNTNLRTGKAIVGNIPLSE